jgi:hypothetical protein
MRKIPVTGGYTDYAEGTLREIEGKDIQLADFRLALIPAGTSVPERTSEVWKVPDLIAFLKPDTVKLSMLVTDAVPLGNYYLYALPIDNPTATPVMATNHMIVVV